MQAFTTLRGLVAPLDRPNVDTDAMVPKQFLKRITRTGFGPNLFDEWRYLNHGEPDMDCSQRPKNPAFVLNEERYTGAQILLARENFGCGSSREHAPWAFLEFGIRVIIAPSFADIFYSNCFKNGLLLIKLETRVVDRLFEAVDTTPGYALDVDLAKQVVCAPSGETIAFEIDRFHRHCLLNGLDEIGLSMVNRDRVLAHEARLRQSAPWLLPGA
ncbi:MAG: 3-isopropylmalate dehydratase small subunit [Burkholderiaceae bacterium]